MCPKDVNKAEFTSAYSNTLSLLKRVSAVYVMSRHCLKLGSYLETLRLLADFHSMLTTKFPLPSLVVLLLIGELCLVLQADQLSPRLLDDVELAELQFLHGFMVPEKHGVFQILLSLTLV